MANPLCHFELTVTDPAKAQEFYGKVFDWKFEREASVSDYTMIRLGAEPDGGMMKKPDQAPHPALCVYFLVEDIEATLAKVNAGGGKTLIGKTEIPMGSWAMFLDPDNIPVGIFQAKK